MHDMFTNVETLSKYLLLILLSLNLNSNFDPVFSVELR